MLTYSFWYVLPFRQAREGGGLKSQGHILPDKEGSFVSDVSWRAISTIPAGKRGDLGLLSN
jgi:hypothetical protein